MESSRYSSMRTGKKIEFLCFYACTDKSLRNIPAPSTDEWIKKMWCIYTVEYYSTIKKSEIMPFVAIWMDLEIIILSEVSQTKKEKYHMISLICGI